MPSVLKKKAPVYLDTTQQITAIALSACLVAKDATYNVRDFIQGGSKMALLAVRDCEKELERIGDLTWSVAHRLEQLTARLPRDDARDLVEMTNVIEKMLTQVHTGFQ